MNDESNQSGAHSSNGDYRCEMPFWIDTDAYTDRDRRMFVCGVEFEMIHSRVKAGWCGEHPIHRENESRIRMMCGRLGRRCLIEQGEGFDGCEEWSYLTVFEDGSES